MIIPNESPKPSLTTALEDKIMKIVKPKGQEA
jgi:hypothetical protein